MTSPKCTCRYCVQIGLAENYKKNVEAQSEAEPWPYVAPTESSGTYETVISVYPGAKTQAVPRQFWNGAESEWFRQVNELVDKNETLREQLVEARNRHEAMESRLADDIAIYKERARQLFEELKGARRELAEAKKLADDYREDAHYYSKKCDKLAAELAELKQYGTKPCPSCGDYFESNDKLEAERDTLAQQLARAVTALEIGVSVGETINDDVVYDGQLRSFVIQARAVLKDIRGDT